MKNVQVIDDARNCSYDIFSATDEDFYALFPAQGQDIEFIDDFIERVGDPRAKDICDRLWSVRADKKGVTGIQGTLFYGLEYKKKYYPTKREREMVVSLE
ncbi:MAG TPA: hypothetical protein VMR86_09930 [Myxococcota bacterium]|nr:hypothetical protein [Myxococcota bacterium]